MATALAETEHVKEQRAWLNTYKEENKLSWNELGRLIGRASSTLSLFGADKYDGVNDEIAGKIAIYRQSLTDQAKIGARVGKTPDYFETPTSLEICSMLDYARTGDMVAAAMGAGCGKSSAVKHFSKTRPNVWVVEAAPSTSRLLAMQIAVCAALGRPSARGQQQALSAWICERVEGTGGLLIFDEAQHLADKTIEEIRSWHDRTGVGIAFTGNIEVVSKLEGGSRRAAFAQIFSRLGMRLIQPLPKREDAEALATAWGITDARMRNFIISAGLRDGGLRTATKMLRLATLMSSGHGEDLTLAHLQESAAQLGTRGVAA